MAVLNAFFLGYIYRRGQGRSACGVKMKWALRAIAAYVLFGLLMYWYLFHYADAAIPAQYKGTAADPATFMSGRQLFLSEAYSKIRNLLFSCPCHMSGCFIFWCLCLVFPKCLKNGQRQFHTSASFKPRFISFGFRLQPFCLPFRSIICPIVFQKRTAFPPKILQDG